MQVLHVASSYPLNEEDSTAPFMQEMLRGLAERGIEVTVVVPRTADLLEGSRAGVTVVGAPYAPQILQVYGYSRSLDAENRLRASALAIAPLALTSMGLTMRRRIAKRRPDVVHLHWALPQGLLAGVVPKGIPLVLSAHGADVRFAHGRLRPLARRILARADAVVAASSEILALLAKIQPSVRGKGHVIPHGANTQLFAPASKREARVELGVDPHAQLLLAVGRLVRKKGFAALIGSMGLLADTEARLFIVGDGPERGLLERLTLEANGRVHIVGAQSREMVAKWIAASDVVVVPGIADGYDVDSGPVVLMEALASGRPVVAAKTGMAPELIEDDVNGYLLQSISPETIAAAVRRAFDKSEALGQGARSSFESVGDWNRVAADLEAVYRFVVDPSRLS